MQDALQRPSERTGKTEMLTKAIISDIGVERREVNAGLASTGRLPKTRD